MGAVLAGGRGRRTGGAKALLELRGRPLVTYPVEALRGTGLETVVVAKEASALPSLDVPVVIEPPEPVHPLRGILTALEAAGGRPVVVCGCDMPFLTPELLRHLAEQEGELVVAAVRGRLHPLLGLYTPSVGGALSRALASERPLQEVARAHATRTLDEPELRRFGDPERLLFNVNTLADLERAEALLGGDSPGR